jgi:hypothetical protein
MKQFFSRISGTIQLEPKAYLEVKENHNALKQAIMLALLSSISTAIGSVGGYLEKIPMGLLTACGAWGLWITCLYIFGTWFFPEPGKKTNLKALISVMGFASIPGMLKLFAFLPAVSGIILFGATVWMVAASAVATQQAFNYNSFPRAIGVSFAAWIVYQFMLFQI